MAIIKRPARTLDEFVSAAPDAARKGVLKGIREQITLTLDPELLGKLDALAVMAGQSRAALIRRAMFELVERGGVIPKKD